MTTEELTADIEKKKQLLIAAETALTGTLEDSVVEATFHTGTYGAYQRYKKVSTKELMNIIQILESQIARLERLLNNGSGLIGQRLRRYR